MSESPAGGLDLESIAISLDAAERTWGRTHEMVMLGRELLAEVQALRTALRPFAIAAAEYQEESAGCVITDGLQIDGESAIAHPILWGDLRRAAAVLGAGGLEP